MATRRTLADCHVTLGVTGSIAAYKAAEIVRLLRRRGIDVRVVMTRAGARLMSPDALATLSERPVALEMFQDPSAPRPEIDHLELGRGADLFVVAPASADILGKVAGGIADDLLSTALMASPAPVLYAPAMNTRMWQHPATQRNVERLRQDGAHFIGPDAGDLACGETGAGRMVAPEAVVDQVCKMLLARLDGLRVLITAGPTEEPLDPVRVISNRSSGVMGVRLAEAARDRGHRVTMIAGPLRCPGPLGVECVTVATAHEMELAVQGLEARADILIMAAAVADYRAAEVAEAKLPSKSDALELKLVPTRDILASIAPGRAARGAVTVGFALEIGEGAETRAAAKLKAKGADMVVLNDATRSDSLFGGQTTRPTFLFGDGRIQHFETMTKQAAADQVLEQAEELHALKVKGGSA